MIVYKSIHMTLFKLTSRELKNSLRFNRGLELCKVPISSYTYNSTIFFFQIKQCKETNSTKKKSLRFHVFDYICILNLRNNSQMPGSMLILTWVGIIFVIILHRVTEVIFGCCSNYLPLLFTRIYNTTETFQKLITIKN